MSLRAIQPTKAAPDAFEALFASSPWPLLLLDARGALIGCTDDPRLGLVDSPLRRLARAHYLPALQPWVAPLREQRLELGRPGADGTELRERLYLRPAPWGASLTVVDLGPMQAPASADPQTARLAALGFMVAGVCHELGNPLTSLRSLVQLLRAERRPSPALLDRSLGTIAASVERILEISRRLVEFSRLGDAPQAVFAVDEAIDEALYVLQHDGRLDAVEVTRETDREALVRGHAGQLREVFLNLLVNALQAMDGPGRLWITSRRSGAAVEVTLRDSGPGITPRDAARLFEPFFTTKGRSGGTGLGLSISHEIALEHGGRVELLAEPGPGATFVVSLPEACG